MRQQVRLGLPCQEVGRACGSYLIYGRAGAQRPTLTFSERQRANTENENALPHLPLLTHLFIEPVPVNLGMCAYVRR